ncbi:EAL domain-containing protein [Citrobacter portucalensis]|uniref:EAL domain-containing protein n=1 Tax=Citrobacter portucalensis TaxID=1639133 RepID=UPI001A28AF98|nr:EAL domain-containing protein [Citrobacter portucalensis]
MLYSETRLRQAINNHEFMPFYQPIINGRDGTIAGCEVLCRWLTPEYRLIDARFFIRDIALYGLMETMTMALVDKIILDINKLAHHARHDFLLTLNVNLSLITSPGFESYLVVLDQLFAKFGLTLIFEITEHEDIRLFQKAQETFRKLGKYGIKFAVDDFGTGYAAEDLLNISQAQFIKLDRQFIADLECPASTKFIEQTLCMSRRRGTQVIAEGVENWRQECHLKKMGIDYQQGYFHCHPVPFAQFNKYLSCSDHTFC